MHVERWGEAGKSARETCSVHILLVSNHLCYRFRKKHFKCLDLPRANNLSKKAEGILFHVGMCIMIMSICVNRFSFPPRLREENSNSSV